MEKRTKIEVRDYGSGISGYQHRRWNGKPLIGMSVTLEIMIQGFRHRFCLGFRTRHMHQTTRMHYAPFRFSTFFVSIDRVVHSVLLSRRGKFGLSLCQNPKKKKKTFFFQLFPSLAICSSCSFQECSLSMEFVLNFSQWQKLLKRFSIPMNTICAQKNF